MGIRPGLDILFDLVEFFSAAELQTLQGVFSLVFFEIITFLIRPKGYTEKLKASCCDNNCVLIEFYKLNDVLEEVSLFKNKCFNGVDKPQVTPPTRVFLDFLKVLQ